MRLLAWISHDLRKRLEALSLTPRFSGVPRRSSGTNRFSGFSHGVETPQSGVQALGRRAITPLKRGVNETATIRGRTTHEICGLAQIFNLSFRPLCLAGLVFGLAAGLLAQPAAPEEGRTRFCAVDIYVDSKATPLAAYQLEFVVTNGLSKIVGIEGGEHPAFHEPPFYDPKAMQHERVIIAAFNTGRNLPSGRTRVATIHLQTSGTNSLQCQLKLQAAGDAEGGRIAAEASFEERKPQ